MAHNSAPIVTAIMCLALAWPACGDEPQTGFKFAFGDARRVDGFTAVVPTNIYKKGEMPWGFEPGASLRVQGRPAPEPLEAGSITSDKPFYFSVAVPEGNYRVTITAGDAEQPTDLTVKAELRRLMVEHFHLDAGQHGKMSFVVNVRVPEYPGGAVRLKGTRESVDEAWAWDEKLTLEFNNKHPNICGIEIEKVDVPTVYLVGDSTMCDQGKEPWNSWGQMFPRFFKDDIAIANHAESGETVSGSLSAHRFDKVWSLMKPGDYLLFAFGHNDMKIANNLERYKSDYRHVIEQTKAKGGIPVVVSSMERMNGVEKDTLEGYPDAARQIAEEEKVAFIDLHGVSRQFYKGLGPADLHLAFSYANGKQDGTHNNDYGSYEISKLVLEGVRQGNLGLVAHIKPGVPSFDPAHPDRPADFKVPFSPVWDGTRPPGD